MSKRWAWGLAGVVGVLLGLAPGTARAWSCIPPQLLLPARDQTGVPTDTLLWGYSGSETRLLGPSGEVIELDQRALILSQLYSKPDAVPVLIPRSALQPNARYVIEVDGSEAFPPDLIAFVTGAGPAATPPAQPVLVASEPQVSGTVGGAGGRWRNLLFEGIRERGLIVIGTAGQVGRDVAAATSSVEQLLTQGEPSATTVAEAKRFDWLFDSDSITVGLTACANWPDEAPDALTAQFAALDLAGNFSGWVDVPIELPPESELQAAVAAERAAYDEEQVRIAAENAARLDAANPERASCATARGPATAAGSSLATAALIAAGFVRRRARSKQIRHHEMR